VVGVVGAEHVEEGLTDDLAGTEAGARHAVAEHGGEPEVGVGRPDEGRYLREEEKGVFNG